eukprot:GHVU01047687.1.p1 GENE.GHVU01047687.1~~GHVU01047687.1.p1  ORF type:complete len:145 (-),score=42.08 GHVU01047687.1:57-491(-)
MKEWVSCTTLKGWRRQRTFIIIIIYIIIISIISIIIMMIIITIIIIIIMIIIIMIMIIIIMIIMMIISIASALDDAASTYGTRAARIRTDEGAYRAPHSAAAAENLEDLHLRHSRFRFGQLVRHVARVCTLLLLRGGGGGGGGR